MSGAPGRARRMMKKAVPPARASLKKRKRNYWMQKPGSEMPS